MCAFSEIPIKLQNCFNTFVCLFVLTSFLLSLEKTRIDWFYKLFSTFYAQRLGIRIHFTFIFTFLCLNFLANRYQISLMQIIGKHLYGLCSPKDQPKAMNDREKWRERVRDIRASGTTWWWFLYNADNYIVSRNCFYLIFVICLKTVR